MSTLDAETVESLGRCACAVCHALVDRLAEVIDEINLHAAGCCEPTTKPTTEAP
jgi:hypothetical protein